jgi:cobalamin biosynthesis Mg chelatase CobN
MGAQVNTQYTSISNEALEQVKNNCKNVAITNQHQSANFILSSGCHNTVINAGQTSSTQLDCSESATLSELSTAAVKVAQTAKAGLGFSFNTSVTQIRDCSEEYLQQNCSNLSSTDQFTAYNIDCNASSDTLNLMQNADTKTQCLVNAAAGIVNRQSAATQQTATGFSLGAFLGILIAIIIVIVIIVVIFMALKGAGRVVTGLGSGSAKLISSGSATGTPGGTLPGGVTPSMNSNLSVAGTGRS